MAVVNPSRPIDQTLAPVTALAPRAPDAPESSALAKELAERLTRRGPRAGRWILLHALGIGIGISLCWHAMLSMIGFTPPEPTIKKARDGGLAVVLVNARHARAPKEAQALAQANLEGGGNAEDPKAMPASPLPPRDARREGDALVDMQQRVQKLEARQRELLRRAKVADLAMPEQQARQPGEQPTEMPPVTGGLDLSTATAIARQEAVVAKQFNDYAGRPRRAVVSPRTREYELAQYAEEWRRKVERIGEYNFPRGVQGSLYGSVQISVEIAPDGKLISVDITKPDLKTQEINEAALDIIRKAAPFARLPQKVLEKYDTIVLTRTLNFTRDEISAGNN